MPFVIAYNGPPGATSSARPRTAGRPSVGATAAAGATALIAATVAWQPWLPPGLGPAADAIVNEWLMWFTGLYLALLAAVAVSERHLWRVERFQGARATRGSQHRD